MIYKLNGELIMKEGGKIAVDTGGIAYEVSLSMSSYSNLPSIGEKVEIFTHLSVREDGFYLYGFGSLGEKELFLLLNKVSKIGPKTALSILGNIEPQELVNAIISADAVRLSKMPGIGKKTAERIIVELKDKLDAFKVGLTYSTKNISMHDDVISALSNLGYKTQDCEKILSTLKDYNDFQAMFKAALSELMK